MAEIKKEFDWITFSKEAKEQLLQGVPLEGKEGIFAPMLKHLLETSLEGELEGHLKRTD